MGFVDTVGRPFFIANGILLFEVIVLSIPYVNTLWHDFRWWRIGGIIPYHFIGAFALFSFTAVLLVVGMRRKNWVNNLLFTLSMGLGGLVFFWSGYVDSTTGDTSSRTIDSWLHDSVWFPIMAMFVLVFYLHLEFQTNDYPPLKRVIPVIASTSPAFFVGIVSLISRKDFIHDPSLGTLVANLLFLGGLLFTSVQGTYSYFLSLKNYDLFEGGASDDAKIQFAALAGLTEGMILFALDNALDLPLNIQFPLILITFLIPLMIIYIKNPNYISVLATPILELLVVNESGVTAYSYSFINNNGGTQNPSTAFLKGSILSAIFTVFNEIAGKESSFNEVDLEGRAFLVEKVWINDTTWVVGVIATAPCYYIKQSIHIFSELLKELIIQYEVNNKGAILEIPSEVNSLVKEIFT